MAITQSDRTDFVGAHVTPKVKRALMREAFARGMSMSKFVSIAVEEKLAALRADASTNKGTK